MGGEIRIDIHSVVICKIDIVTNFDHACCVGSYQKPLSKLKVKQFSRLVKRENANMLTC